jgi:pilus assembly protein Flp/PilA
MSARFFKRLHDDIAGATAIEYSLIIALVAIAAVAAIWGVRGETVRMWERVETRTVDAITK